MQNQVSFLGHILSKDGIKADPVKIAKVKDWQMPTNLTELRSFLGFCSYYRRFVNGFSMIAKPLTELTKKESTLKWDTNCQQAFDRLKHLLISSDVVSHLRDSGQIILDTDASDFGGRFSGRFSGRFRR
jgi:hypothetical protein